MKTSLNFLLLVFILISCEETIETPSLGQIAVSDITNNSAYISCNVTNDGNSQIDTIGICWSTDEMPTIENSTFVLEHTNSISHQLTNLIPKSKYYVRSFAINKKGLSYSAEKSFTTEPNDTDIFIDPRDGQEYKIVKIGDEWWFADNLNFKNQNSWYFNEDSISYSTIGRLYTYESALDAIPEGWKMPSDNDWAKLEKQLGMDITEVYETHWRGIGLANYLLENKEYDFDIVWSGKRDTTLAIIYSEINNAYFWSSTEFKDYTSDNYKDSYFGREFASWSESIKRNVYQGWLGLSVRCIKE